MATQFLLRISGSANEGSGHRRLWDDIHTDASFRSEATALNILTGARRYGKDGVFESSISFQTFILGSYHDYLLVPHSGDSSRPRRCGAHSEGHCQWVQSTNAADCILWGQEEFPDRRRRTPAYANGIPFRDEQWTDYPLISPTTSCHTISSDEQTQLHSTCSSYYPTFPTYRTVVAMVRR